MILRTLLRDSFKLAVLLGDSTIIKSSGPAIRHRIKKVLIVRVDAIGDFVLWLDAAKQLRKIYPQDRYTITLLGNSTWAGLADKLPYWDEFLSLDRVKFERHVSYRWRFLRRIRDIRFDLAIQPNYFRDEYVGDTIVRASHAAERIGSAGEQYNINKVLKKYCDRWYTRLVPAELKPLTALERNAEFMRGLGLKNFSPSLPRLPFGKETLRRFPSLPSHYYILFPGAGQSIKRWPVNRFGELARLLYRTKKIKGVICGGLQDRILATKLASSVPDVPLYNMVGRTTLLQLFGLIAQADLVVSNDTSGVHFAAAAGTPAVCILGGGHYGLFLPYRLETQTDQSPLPRVVIHPMNCFGCNWRCRYSLKRGNPAPCIARISTDAVWEQVRELDRSKDNMMPR
jgi:ADP-heptose:LPS heptosyltransferase